MRVAITGVSGLLGKYLAMAAPVGVDVVGISRSPLMSPMKGVSEHIVGDISDASVIERMRHLRVDTVIHAAAEGRVDVVQGRLAEFRDQNVLASERLAEFAESASIPFAHISSNAVFGGRETPYDDWDTHDPVNDYGRLKSEAENAVRSANASALVVRPILMYGWAPSGARRNPVNAWVANLRKGEEIRVVDDVTTEPLYALDCARVIWRALEREIVGPVNVSGGESMTLYSLACQVADAFQLEPDLITAVSSNEFTDLAPRPRSTSFTLGRVRGELGFEPLTPSEGLRELQIHEGP